MKKNTLSIKFREDGSVQTDITTADGSSMMEIHRRDLHDSVVLRKIQERKYYQDKSGEWIFTFPQSNRAIQMPTFDKAVDAAQEFIFFRDNGIEYDGFY